MTLLDELREDIQAASVERNRPALEAWLDANPEHRDDFEALVLAFAAERSQGYGWPQLLAFLERKFPGIKATRHTLPVYCKTHYPEHF